MTNAQDALRQHQGPCVIALTARPDGDRVTLEVRDTGPGIPPDVLPRLFEPFYTTKASGTGLGLAIAAGIIGDLGGELTAANEAGGGAVFRIALSATRLN